MDEDALAALYRAYQPELLEKLQRRFRWSQDLVADAIQTAFLKLQDIDPQPIEPRAWLFTVARHQIIDELRRQGRMAGDDAIDSTPAEVQRTTTGPLPSPTLVQRALLELTSRAQRLLRGKYEEEKTYGTLARQEGVAKGSMGRLLDRARQRLRDRVNKLQR